MEFGRQLSELRKKRGFSQKQLASLAAISPTHLSLIENGKDLPSQETAERCIDALELEPKARKQLLQALKRDRDSPARQQKEIFFFGKVLKDTLRELGMSLTDLAGSMERPFFTVHSWAAGSMLPSDKTLSSELIPALRAAKASEANIRALKKTHIKDVLTRSLKLAYLDDGEREKLLSRFFHCLG